MIRAAVLFVALTTLAACQPDPFGRSASEVRNEKMQCEADGGTFQEGGLTGALMCFRPTIDAGTTCKNSNGCQSLCFAYEDRDEGYCAAVTPIFGCNEIFDENGQRGVLCID